MFSNKMFPNIRTVFNKKQKIYPERTAKPSIPNKPVSQPTNSPMLPRISTLSTSMSGLSTIANIETTSIDLNVYANDPCVMIYERCKDPTAYDILRQNVK
jgi:hypothetical protein